MDRWGGISILLHINNVKDQMQLQSTMQYANISHSCVLLIDFVVYFMVHFNHTYLVLVAACSVDFDFHHYLR
jgi:hypothetical protein